MNGLFIDEKFRKVIEETSLELIKKASLVSKESFQLEDELLSNLDRYIDDVIDYLNNSDIDKLIFKKDINFLNLKYDYEENLYVLLGKKNVVICQLQIVDIEWIYKNLYLNNFRDRYGGNVYITYKPLRTKQHYKLKNLNKKSKIVSKILKDCFSVETHVYGNLFLNYKKKNELYFSFYIGNNMYRIGLNDTTSDKFKFIFNIIGEEIKDINNLKDFKMFITQIKHKNFYLSELLENETFKGISFDNYNERFKFNPFIEFEENKLKFIVDLKDFDNLLNNDLCISIDGGLLNFQKLKIDKTNKSTGFKLFDYINKKDEVLEYLKLQNY